MSKELKVAFIGGGINSAVGQAHKIALQMDGNFELVAGCFSRDAETNFRTAEAWGVDSKRVYETYNELLSLEKGRLDAVLVLTPTPSHKEIVVECLMSGFLVVCEKSLAMSVREAEEIKACMDRYKGKLVVTYNYSGYPMLRELRERIRRGQLGKLEQILIEMPQEGFSRLNNQGAPHIPQSWRLKDHSIPTLSLDLGVHLHQIINFLSQEKPLEVIGFQSHFGNFKEVVDNVHCLASYTNGLVCNIWYGKTAFGYRNGLRIRVFGTEGAAEWLQMTPERLVFSDNKGRQFILDRASSDNIVANEKRYNRFKVGHPAGFIEAFANYYHDVADFIRSSGADTGNVFGLELALEGLEMLERLHKKHF